MSFSPRRRWLPTCGCLVPLCMAGNTAATVLPPFALDGFFGTALRRSSGGLMRKHKRGLDVFHQCSLVAMLGSVRIHSVNRLVDDSRCSDGCSARSPPDRLTILVRQRAWAVGRHQDTYRFAAWPISRRLETPVRAAIPTCPNPRAADRSVTADRGDHTSISMIHC
jgi:hypothetical protein